jgi:DNA/RNA-binding domain of Phe-tRNA-synthetase-like protein
MQILYSGELIKKYNDFNVISYKLKNNNNREFYLSEELENIIIENFDSSMQEAKLMSRFYNIFNKKNKCHIENLLEAFKKNKRFKKNNYLVDVVYFLELNTGYLMGVHDMNNIDKDITFFLANGNEKFLHISNNTFIPEKNTICIKDNNKIFASLLGGPDSRTKIIKQSQEAILFIFIPPCTNKSILINNLKRIDDYLEYFKIDYEVI